MFHIIKLISPDSNELDLINDAILTLHKQEINKRYNHYIMKRLILELFKT